MTLHTTFSEIASKPQRLMLFLAFTIVAFTARLDAQTVYTTLNDGAWSSTSVWSTDGVTPCSCAPSQIVFGFDVVINHTITTTGMVRNGTLDSIFVNGSLSTSWLIASGYIENRGTVSVDSLWITAPPGRFATYGTANITGRVYIAGGDLDIYSSMSIGANLEMNNGNVFVFPGSTLFILGDFNMNNGASARNVSATSCISITGNLNASSTSVIGGSGGVYAVNNINNSVVGNWAPTVLWCAGGTGFNLPTAPSCGSTPCTTPLPVEILDLQAFMLNTGNASIQWVTAEELNNEYFTLFRSQDGAEFTEVGRVQGAGTSKGIEAYEFVDEFPLQGRSWYRLSQTDLDGKTEILGTVSILNFNEKEQEFAIYPNPITDWFNVAFNSIETEDLDLNIYDLSGKKIYNQTLTGHEGVNEIRVSLPDLPRGHYLVTIGKGSVKLKHFKVVRQ